MIVLAHRGGRENKLSGFREFPNAEMDLRVTKDGSIVCAHDPIVKSNRGTEPISSLTLRETKELGIASFSEVLDAITCRGLRIPDRIQLDLKPGMENPELISDMLALIRLHGLGDAAIVSSFIGPIIREVRRQDSKIATGFIKILPSDPVARINELKKPGRRSRMSEFLYRAYLRPMLALNLLLGSALADQLRKASDLKADFVLFYDLSATKRFVKKAHERGFKVVVGMANSDWRMRRVRRLGISDNDVVVTDNMRYLARV